MQKSIVIDIGAKYGFYFFVILIWIQWKNHVSQFDIIEYKICIFIYLDFVTKVNNTFNFLNKVNTTFDVLDLYFQRHFADHEEKKYITNFVWFPEKFTVIFFNIKQNSPNYDITAVQKSKCDLLFRL